MHLRILGLSLLLLLLCVAAPLVAQSTAIPVHVLPPHPTVQQDVVLRFRAGCPLEPAQVTRTGHSILVFLREFGLCDPPIAIDAVVNLGRLPAGTYDVRIEQRPGVLHTTATFSVYDAPRPTRVHPLFLPTTGGQLYFPRGEEYLPCHSMQCTITVDGVVVPRRAGPAGGVVADAPAHAAGFADLVVTQSFGERSVEEKIYYFDRGTPPDPLYFERILFPVLFNATGANGSEWRSEAVVVNGTHWTIETYNVTVPARRRLQLDGVSAREGIALIVPRSEADKLSTTLRIRDVSRVAEGFGTEIPTVREHEMFRDAVITLVDVPVDHRYRVKVRFYAWEAGGAGTLRAGEASYPFTLVRNCTTALACATVPYYAELDLPAGALDERVNLSVEMPEGSLAWAFASVTNNATQQVTIVTP
jgi:hypothetical protein